MNISFLDNDEIKGFSGDKRVPRNISDSICGNRVNSSSYYRTYKRNGFA